LIIGRVRARRICWSVQLFHARSRRGPRCARHRRRCSLRHGGHQAADSLLL